MPSERLSAAQVIQLLCSATRTPRTIQASALLLFGYNLDLDRNRDRDAAHVIGHDHERAQPNASSGTDHHGGGSADFQLGHHGVFPDPDHHGWGFDDPNYYDTSHDIGPNSDGAHSRNALTAATGSTAQSTDSAAGDDDGLSPWLIGIIAACALAAIGLVYFCCCVRNKQGGLDRGKPAAHVHNPTYTDPHPHDQPQQQPYGVVSGLPSSTGGGGDGTAAYADIPATRSSQTAYDASASPDSGAGLQSVIRPNYATNYATLGGNRHSGAVVYSAGPQSTYSARPQYAEAADVTDGATNPPVAPVYAAVNRSGARDGRRSRSRGGQRRQC